MNRVVLEAKHAAETRTQTWDFASRLATGESLSSATVSSTVYSGSASAPTLGTVSVSGTRATHTLGGGVAGDTYLLSVAAVTSAGQTLNLVGFLPILPNAQ